MLAAVARKDYDDRRRRQAQGQAKAKAENRYKGRVEDVARNAGIASMLKAGQSWSAIQAATGCSRATIAKIAKRQAQGCLTDRRPLKAPARTEGVRTIAKVDRGVVTLRSAFPWSSISRVVLSVRPAANTLMLSNDQNHVIPCRLARDELPLMRLCR
jgi:hypothetical protein